MVIKKIKRKLVLFLLLANSLGYCQVTTDVDSTSISFKAKLFTISEYGIAKKDSVISYVESQKITFLKSPYKNFIFLKIDFDQPYTKSNGHVRSLIRYCSYYVVYNIIDCRYYRIGGFDINDIDVFFKDLKLRELDIFMGSEGNDVEEIDIDCMYDYSLLNKKKRFKKGYNCFEKCSDNTSIFYENK